jgi:hypothetical protein
MGVNMVADKTRTVGEIFRSIFDEDEQLVVQNRFKKGFINFNDITETLCMSLDKEANQDDVKKLIKNFLLGSEV